MTAAHKACYSNYSDSTLDYQSIFDELKNNLKTTPLIKDGVAADAETYLKKMEDIIVNFQPLRDYREMLSNRP